MHMLKISAIYGLSVPDALTKYSTSTLIITLSTDRAEPKSLLTNSSASSVCVDNKLGYWTTVHFFVS